jgi:TolA-binding protein
MVLYLQRNFLKRLYMRHQRLDEIQRCRLWLEKNQHSDECSAVQYKIARIYHSSLTDFSQSILEYRKFLQDYPESILAENAWYYMGRCWEELGNLDRALRDYTHLQENYPQGMRCDDASIRMEEIRTIQGSVGI